MSEEVPEQAWMRNSDRRRFLRKAGVAGGVAWVAPTVLSLSSPAAAASGPPFRVSVPFGPGPSVPISCGGGSVHLEFVQLPDPWVVNLVSTVPIEILLLNLVSVGAVIVTPTNGPPNFPVTTNILNIRGTGVPQNQSFFDVFYDCGP